MPPPRRILAWTVGLGAACLILWTAWDLRVGWDVALLALCVCAMLAAFAWASRARLVQPRPLDVLLRAPVPLVASMPVIWVVLNQFRRIGYDETGQSAAHSVIIRAQDYTMWVALILSPPAAAVLLYWLVRRIARMARSSSHPHPPAPAPNTRP